MRKRLIRLSVMAGVLGTVVGLYAQGGIGPIGTLPGKVDANNNLVTTFGSGAATCYITSAASTNATLCQATPGSLYSIHAVNTTATIYFLRLYNLATAPTCSSATGFVESIPVPASASGAGIVVTEPVGRTYSTGIGFCLTGGGSSTDNTNAATGVYVSIGTK